jgi:UDP-N-acetylglucosamine--N-acetylmuramyl-(pentapeptide) pyrophosphoryl-undecaprenol N-acetylglucosamine transferase
MSPKKCVVLAAGGTGGHVFPAQALAQELTAQSVEVYLFTDERGQTHTVNIPNIVKIPAAQLQGSGVKKLKEGIELLRGIKVASRHLRRLRPYAVVGFGGYASFPTLIAAIILRIPLFLHQADAYLGRVNRWLAPFAKRLATSFPYVENIPTSCQKKVSFTGLPLRAEIKPAPYVSSEDFSPFRLLVTGGSQGARVFGEVIPQAVSLLDPSLQKRLHISQQCRAESIELTKKLYDKTKAKVELSSFLENMGERYKKAHLIISRSGASSVGEAALVGRPAIFVPYPYAMDDHQYYNAQQSVKVEGGWMFREKDLNSRELASFLSDLIISPWKLSRAAANIRELAVPDAALKLADLIKQFVT